MTLAIQEPTPRAVLALDRPSRLGLDSDQPAAAGEVSRGGVALDSIHDFERLFDGLALDEARPHFVAGAAAPVVAALYQAFALERDTPADRLSGVVEHGGALFPARPSARLLADLREHLARTSPQLSLLAAHPQRLQVSDPTVTIIHRTPAELAQQARLAELRAARDPVALNRALERVLVAAKGGDNLLPYLVDAARARATLGEMTATLRRVFGAPRSASSRPGGET